MSGPERAVFWIEGRLPGLNDMIAARSSWAGRGRRGRRRWNAYADLKRDGTAQVKRAAKDTRVRSLRPPVRVTCEWHEPNRRRDPDNVAAGGLKLILDGLVAARVLPGDGARVVAEIRHVFRYDTGEAGVLVTLEEVAGGDSLAEDQGEK